MPSTRKSLKGQLLLDGGKLQGSFFHRTVVLICQHDPEGAFGLVLNRETENRMGDVLDAELPDDLKTRRLYLGGPVQPTSLSYLHTDQVLLGPTVIKNLALGHSLPSLIELASSPSPTQKLRVFAGYAGWSPGQLEEEMKREAWLTHPASLRLVFDVPPGELWQTILRKKGWPQRLLADAPEDLSWN